MRTLIENLEFILTVDRDDRVLRDVSVVIEDDRIADISSGGMAREAFDAVIDGRRYGMTPGFIDSHVHLGETLSRAVFPDQLPTMPTSFLAPAFRTHASSVNAVL